MTEKTVTTSRGTASLRTRRKSSKAVTSYKSVNRATKVRVVDGFKGVLSDNEKAIDITYNRQ
ncbi:hypothetical protein AJ85_17880 [Alkalihalobacillus alcalophilus ATCC 27647 = CGMCC 1.3604]|uniref:Uncharacterized protein n=1 Tax=Alkalihalobacillus alcalophilus ATCC 27647 = CGMCC 1.3604 TaxID=1218173 RepID=A0A094XIQ7_ALKAL|nr:hypothetical protein [Alkalihalobacillus alcalophilus]KGA98645.1 hypothetical protein BALCAV_0203210 [Alkalihalobacillus alcalophilus ATCC 27647 = CGMCC 1.3604]MED1564280.1 hypothetical protein [Alkalihalobacillus alcalophilus]THG89405.1 hypothetical protein AJ85_17880 [Alkalihalobacillus alcalophilus ATCC 27647 = CGMCC 1.3604]